MTARLAIVVAAAVLGAGCGSEEEAYPQDAVDNFMRECVNSAVESAEGQLTEARARESCECVIDELQVTLPYEEFRRFDTRVRVEGDDAEAPDEVIDAISNCAEDA